LNYLGGKICKKCGSKQYAICSYEFHHNFGDKEAEISKLIKDNKPFEEIKKELDKCQVVCSNCHKEIHYFKIKI